MASTMVTLPSPSTALGPNFFRKVGDFFAANSSVFSVALSASFS